MAEEKEQNGTAEAGVYDKSHYTSNSGVDGFQSKQRIKGEHIKTYI